MRKATVVLFLGVAVAALASVSSIKWKSLALDLGEVKVGEVQALEFEFTNTSDTPVSILEAKGSCGCTQVEYSKAPIQSGGRAFVKANFTASKAGVFNKNIRVKTSNSDEYTFLRFKGEALK